MLLLACILSGCDYCESIKGIGFKTALKLLITNEGDIHKIVRHLTSQKYDVRPTYLEEFIRAELTFKH